MTDIRALRLSRGLTLSDLALLTEIPVRRLAELEHGMRELDTEIQAQLANVFDVPPEHLSTATRQHPSIEPAARWMKRCAYLLIAMIVGLLFPVVPMLNAQPAASAAPPKVAPTPADGQTRALANATARPQPSSASPVTPAPQPTHPPPSPTPRFALDDGGPHGCPLAPQRGHVVLTQGYDGGTHTPTSVWGAVDLAIDGDGDGNAEPETTQGVSISATLGGVAHVFLGSWPGGNFVRIVDEQAGWSTAYAHLDSVAVAEGQTIGAGALVGTVGSTGMASGPHLHYEVWRGGTNMDPTGLIECH